MYLKIRQLAAERVAATSLRKVAAAAGISHTQLLRWLADGERHRELRADAFCRLADSLDAITTEEKGKP